MLDKTEIEYEFYTEITETVVSKTIKPNMVKLRNELIDYFHNNEITGDRYNFNNVSLGTTIGGDLRVEIEFDRVIDNEVVPIDEDFDPSDRFDSFLKDLSNRYKVNVDYPYWYLPK